MRRTRVIVAGTEVLDIYSAVDDPGMGVAVTQLLVNAIPEPASGSRVWHP